VLSTDDLSPSVQQAEHNRAERRLPERSLDMAAVTISIEPGATPVYGVRWRRSVICDQSIRGWWR
jgi:hypothetical protein